MKKIGFRITACIMAVSLLLTLIGCTKDTNETAEVSETLIGQIQSLDGNAVTLLLGDLIENTAPADMGGSGDMTMPDGTAPADMGGSGDMTPPDGTAPADMGGSGDMTPPDGTAPADMGGSGDMTPPDGAMGGTSNFAAGTETRALTLTDTTEYASTASSDETETVSRDTLETGLIVEVTIDANANILSLTIQDTNSGFGGGMSGMQPNGGSGGSADSGDSAETVTADTSLSGENYSSTTSDENALCVSGDVSVTLTNITLDKSGDSSDNDSSNFYGLNAGLLAKDGATVNIEGGTFTTNASGANAVFSYGTATVNISNASIHTYSDNSGGIQTAGGGTTNASNLTILTEGASAAAIRSDRGGGTVTVDGGSYTTNGTGSPAIYSTADITVSNATLTATASEALVIEGQNSITLDDCIVSGSMSGTYGSDSSENLHGVMIYQSMSGDAEVGEAAFSMRGGSLTTTVGDLIYVTNTACTIELSNVTLTLADGKLLTVAGNDSSRGWGTSGANGGQVVFIADAQKIFGDILVDEISTLQLELSNASSFTGSINSDGTAGEVDVTLDANSTWTLTADSYISSFTGDYANVNLNGFTLYVNGVAAK